jgi:hypothetical protein
MFGHEKSNYAGLYARQAYQTKKDILSQPATAARNLWYETDATIARRLANVAGKPINFARPGTATTYS